jgi:hypothetical protein
MKNLYIILLSMVFLQINSVFSENWEPFPLNQTSYYKITKAEFPFLYNFESQDLIGSIGIINFDSVNVINEYHKEYFSKKYNKLKNDKCLISKLDSLNSNSYDFATLMPDFYSIISDTIYIKVNYYETNKSFTLKFPLNMKEGDSLILKSYDSTSNYSVLLKIKQISKGVSEILSFKDSVITYNIERTRLPKPNDRNFELKLSKKFGFLTFVPLDLLYISQLSIQIQQLELVSVDKNQEHYGEVYDFKYRNRNLFEKPGNIKIYENIWGDPWDYVFIRDSIIGIDNSEDIVFVTYNRQTISSNQGIIPNINKNYTYTYLKKDSIIYEGFNAMVDALRRGETFIPSTNLFDKVPNDETKQIDDSLEVIATPLLFKFFDKCGQKDLQVFYVYQATLDRENCLLPSRFFFDRILDYKMDLWWEINKYLNYASEADQYIGFKDGDCEWGDLSWPPKGLSVFEGQQYNSYLSPNPARSTTRISLQQEGQVAITAVDLLGRSYPLWSGNASTGDMELDVSTLPTGSYTLLIDYGTKREAVRMMKE